MCGSKMFCPECKYYLSGGLFYKNDAELRESFRPWLRWLPARLLWKISVWLYYR